MARFFFLLACALSSAAVTGDQDSIDESISTVSNADSGCDLSRYKDLMDGSRFKDGKKAGSGATGCVLIAKDQKNGGVDVAIKVSKRSGKLQSMKTEFEKAKTLRLAACSSHGASANALKLAERYLPTSLEVGGTDEAPYIIMHSAPGKGIGSFLKSSFKGKQGAALFAQLVGALTAMHSVGYTHNDLHTKNIVIMNVDTDSPALLFIDYSDRRPLRKGWLDGGYKQDETVLAHYAGKFASCPPDALYKHPRDYNQQQHDSQKLKLLNCLESTWKTDKEFLEAFASVMDEAFQGKVPTAVPVLYRTKWVQGQQKNLDSLFPTPQGWCDAEIAQPRGETDMALCQEEQDCQVPEESLSLSNLKWRWAENQVPLVSMVSKTGFEDSWNTPADRDALVNELRQKLSHRKADAKQYKTRAVEFADAHYPERRKTFANYKEAFEWLKLASNI